MYWGYTALQVMIVTRNIQLELLVGTNTGSALIHIQYIEHSLDSMVYGNRKPWGYPVNRLSTSSGIVMLPIGHWKTGNVWHSLVTHGFSCFRLIEFQCDTDHHGPPPRHHISLWWFHNSVKCINMAKVLLCLNISLTTNHCYTALWPFVPIHVLVYLQ